MNKSLLQAHLGSNDRGNLGYLPKEQSSLFFDGVQDKDVILMLHDEYILVSKEEIANIIAIVKLFFESFQLFGFKIHLNEDCPQHTMSLLNRVIAHDMRKNYASINCVLLKQVREIVRFCSNHYENEISFPNSAWITYMKYKTAAFYAYHLNQHDDIPVAPKFMIGKPGILLGGRFYKWMNYLKIREPLKFNEFVETINYLKKGCPSVDQAYANLKLKEATEFLVTERPQKEPAVFVNAVDSWDNDPVVYGKEDVITSLKRTVFELFNRKTAIMTYDKFVKPNFPPSVHSCFEHSVAQGGSLSLINREALDLLQFAREMDFQFPTNPREWIDLDFVDALPIGQIGVEESTYEDHVSFVKLPIISFTLFEEFYEAFYWELWRKALVTPPFTEGVALKEPLKVRPILKGPGILYHVMRPVQKWMWTTLRKFDVFKFIGEPATTEEMERVFFDLEEDEEIINGDFTRSTDFLYSYVSETIGNTLVERFWDLLEPNDKLLFLSKREHFLEEFRTLFIRSLTGHLIKRCQTEDELVNRVMQLMDNFQPHERDQFRIDVQFGKQKTGQSMGSITSFPVLCIANFCGARDAFEWSQKLAHKFSWRTLRLNIRDIPIRINGDDVTMKIMKGYFRIWVQVMDQFGLETSFGKTFHTRDFVMLNSIRWDRETNGKLTKVNYVNFGLLNLVKKSSSESKDSNIPPHKLYTIQRDLLDRCGPALRSNVNDMFFEKNKIKLQRTGLAWFLPIRMGGLGLEPTGFYSLSKQDRIFASYCKKKSIKFPKIKDELVWRTWKIAQDLAMEKGVEKFGFSHVEIDEGIIDLFEYSNLALSKISLLLSYIGNPKTLNPNISLTLEERKELNTDLIYKRYVDKTIFKIRKQVSKVHKNCFSDKSFLKNLEMITDEELYLEDLKFPFLLVSAL